MSNSVLLKFRLWWEEGSTHFHVVDLHGSLIHPEVTQVADTEDGRLYCGGGCVIGNDSEGFAIVLPDELGADWYQSDECKSKIDLAGRALSLLAQLGTPDYDIADNTDPDKVFTVYAREEKGE
jgi:hypothetical protein